MKISPLILIGGALAFMYFRNTSKQNRYFAGVRSQIIQAKLDGKTVVIMVKLQNSNSKPATVKSVFGDVAINGKKVGTANLPKPVEIAPNAETVIELQVKLQIANALTAIPNLVKNIANSMVTFTGTINIDNNPIPTALSYAIGS